MTDGSGKIEITPDDLTLAAGDIPDKPELGGAEVLRLSPKNQLAYAHLVAQRLIEAGEFVHVVPAADALGGYYTQRDINLQPITGENITASFLNACVGASTFNCFRYMGCDDFDFLSQLINDPEAAKKSRLTQVWNYIQRERGEDPLHATALHEFIETLNKRLTNFYERSEWTSPLRLLWTLLQEGTAVAEGPGAHAVALVEINHQDPYSIVKIEALQQKPTMEIEEGGFLELFGKGKLIAVEDQLGDVHLLWPKKANDPPNYDPWARFEAWMATQAFPTQKPFQLS